MVFKRMLLLPCFLILISCVPTYHIEELAIVTASGTDFLENEQLEETFVYFDFEGSKAIPKMVTAKNTTIVGAAMDARLKVKYRLIPDKIQLKLYGMKVAEQGLEPYLDMISRDPKQTDNVSIALSETTAKELLETQQSSQIEGDIGQHLNEIIKKNSPNKQFPYVPLNKLLVDIADHSIDPILPMFSIDVENEPKITSIALLKNDKYIDKLPIKDMLLFNILGRSTVKDLRSDITLPIEPFKDYLKDDMANRKNLNISFELIKGKNNILIVDDNPLTFQTNVDLTLSIIELIGTLPLKNPDVIHLVQKEIEKEVTSRLEKLIETLKELNVDPIGFGEKYRIHQKKQTLTETEWRNIFPNIDVNFNLDVSIVDYGEHS